MLCNPLSVEVAVNGKIVGSTAGELRELLSQHAVSTEKSQWVRQGCWIHGKDCRATIKSCTSVIRERHVTTGKGDEFQKGFSRYGEIHYSGHSTVELSWPVVIHGIPEVLQVTATAAYTKFMWDPLAHRARRKEN